MDKITRKLIKYFVAIITVIILFCFMASSIFLSEFYISMQYKLLKGVAQEIYGNLSSGTANIEDVSALQDVSAVLLRNGSITQLTRSRMGMMPFIKNVDLTSLKQEGKFKTPRGEEFLYYKYSTNVGDIVVFQNNKFSSEYLYIVYLILLLVFGVGLIIAIPLISAAGRRFTQPILKLKNASQEISKGNFQIDFKVNTKDEIEDLYKGLEYMAQSLKRKNDLQREFIANVSHDFKTPLSIIRNYSEAVNDDIIDSEKRKEYSSEIMKEVDRLNNMVMELLELSKLQSGAFLLHKSYFNLKELLLSFQETFDSIVKKRNIKIIINSLDIEIYADSKYLYRVLYNFIDNAIKFSPDFSNIEISAASINCNVKVSVKDWGEGIEESMLENIWTRYYKHKSSGGMGLGLAICSEILKMHGYEYGVLSNAIDGTEFYFTIPVHD